nr:cobalamin-dependent protein [Desulfobulbaceae bacterium]
MRVLLVSLNNELLPEPAFPLGLASIAGSLAETDHEYKLVDLCFTTKDALLSTVTRYKPDVIGLSLRNVDNVAY